MSVYNGEKYLAESIESILAQTYKDFECIIVNNASTDGSLSIMQEYAKKDPRIRLASEEKKGLVYALNTGLHLAQGTYIARMDADDSAYADRFEKQLKFMEDQNIALCGSWANIIDEHGTITGSIDDLPRAQRIRMFALLHNPFIHPSVMVRKDILQKVGGYKPFFKHIEDYELWTRIVFKYKTDNIQEPLLRYRVHGSQITRKNNMFMRCMGILVRFLALWRFIF